MSFREIFAPRYISWKDLFSSCKTVWWHRVFLEVWDDSSVLYTSQIKRKTLREKPIVNGVLQLHIKADVGSITILSFQISFLFLVTRWIM